MSPNVTTDTNLTRDNFRMGRFHYKYTVKKVLVLRIGLKEVDFDERQ